MSVVEENESDNDLEFEEEKDQWESGDIGGSNSNATKHTIIEVEEMETGINQDVDE